MQTVGSAIFVPENWTDLLSIDNVFTSKAPLEVEIGCGKGRFLLSRAASHPQSNFLGIDRMLRRLRKTDKKIIRAGLTNVKLLRIEASYAFDKLLPPSSVSVIYVFFPDPWPKRRHHPRRLFSPAFMNSLQKVLIPGGLIYLATDHIDYSDWIRKLFSEDHRFEKTPHLEPLEEERTEFETLFLKKGTPIERSGFRKKID
jgi:tRNA (guanine-N7-)-methyltransferase